MRKTKRSIALLCALAMVITVFAMFPAMAGATSNNNMTRVVTVGKNQNLQELTNTPILRIQCKNDTFGDQETFRLQLSNSAEWNGTADEIAALIGGPGGVTFEVTRVTDQIIEVKIVGTVAHDETVTIPMNVTLDKASGEQKVTIIPLDSALTSGTYTFAIAEAGATVATVGKAEKMTRGVNNDGATIILDETLIGALDGEQEFRLRLPKGFEWNAGTNVNLNNFGGIKSGLDYSEFGDRDLTVSFSVYQSTSARGSIVINPVVDVTKDASFGDVTVSITNRKGDVTSVTGLVVGEYKDYGIDVEIEEVKEFYAGRLDDEYTTDEITIEETIANSFFYGRVIDFELPSWVALREDFNIEYEDDQGTHTEAIDVNEEDLDDNTFEFRVPEYTTKITFELPITIEGNAALEGPIEIPLTIKGAGIETTSVVVAEAVAPITVEVLKNVEKLELGVQKQPAPDILIKEAYAGAIRDLSSGNRNRLDVSILDAFANSMRFDRFDWEVVEGDIDIDKVSSGTANDKTTMRLVVKAESEEASTIKLSGIDMTLDRTVPKGDFRLKIGGLSLVDNNTDENDFVGFIDRFNYVEVGTPTPGKLATAVFTIDSMTYVVDGVEKEMDVAPYIKDDRTFLPVRYVAEALGVAGNEILWDPDTRQVTIFKGDRIVQMTIGSRVLLVNGAQINMDTVPEIQDGRTMLPIRWVAQAFGESVVWDADARTVTVN